MPPYNKTTLEQGLTKPEKLPVGWPWRLLIFTIIVLGVAVAGYLGMELGYKPYLNSRIKSLDEKTATLTQAIDEKEQGNLATFYSQLINVQDLLASHINPSKLLDFLETNTHSQVHYLSFNFSLTEKSLQLNGNTFNYGFLTQQMKLFQDAPEVERIFLEDSRLLEDQTIQFSMRIILKPEFLKQS